MWHSHLGSNMLRRVPRCPVSESLSMPSTDSPPIDSELSEWLSFRCSIDGDT